MTKTIKVQYSTRYTGRRYSEVPKTRWKANGLMLAGSVLFLASIFVSASALYV